MCLGVERDPKGLKIVRKYHPSRQCWVRSKEEPYHKGSHAKEQKKVEVLLSSHYDLRRAAKCFLGVPKKWRGWSRWWRRWVCPAKQGTSWIWGMGQATVNELQEVTLVYTRNYCPPWSMKYSSVEKEIYIKFSKQNQDVFAWKYSEMPRITWQSNHKYALKQASRCMHQTWPVWDWRW